MSKYEHLWIDHWCLDIKSNKKNQIFEDTYYKLENSIETPKGSTHMEFIIERSYPKIQHIRVFFEKKYSFNKKFKENFNSRKWLEKNYSVSKFDIYPANHMNKVPNLFKIGRYKRKIDNNIDGKNKVIKSEYFHIKIFKKKLNPYKRTFKKVKNISRNNEMIKFEGLNFDAYNDSFQEWNEPAWIILPGAKLTELTFSQDYGNELKKLGQDSSKELKKLSEDYRKEFKKFGSGLKSELKKKFGSFNPFKKKDNK